ncbi:uncharacterized protein G2W53_000681 [Senna tora]|uniref:Uncharacterized protein n=1 Tax=Senna tora TaxID=362788 RepID=A0A835CHX5_9FABA|nr:uncharacterized protein G2W53_000681 [Senna tora]
MERAVEFSGSQVVSEPITFGEVDKANFYDDNDPLVITSNIAGYEVIRVLFYQGSSADIHYFEAFRGMEFKEDRQELFPEKLVGFSGERVAIEVETPAVYRQSDPSEIPISDLFPDLWQVRGL